MGFSATISRGERSSAGAQQPSLWARALFALLAGLVLNGAALAYAVPDATEDGLILPATSVGIRLAQAQPAPTPAPSPAPSTPSAQPASPAQPAASNEPIGNVATLTGTASVIRNQNTIPLKLKDDIYLNDVVATFADSTLGITFNDETTFHLNASASITIDNFVYENGGKQNSALFDVTKGTVAFVASAVAKTGNMKISTPTATLGIRGTTGLVEVNGAGSGAHNIKLYPDPDGHVGTIDVADRNGARLGTLNQGSSGFTIRPGAGGRVTAAPLAISPQQAARDQGIVRQVHAAQNVGRQVVNEQRALRRANPTRANPQGQPGQRQNPQQRQNNLQQRGPQQPGVPNNRTGQQGRPGEPNRAGQQGQPGQPNRAGEPGRPATPNRATEPGQPNRETRQGQPPRPPGAQRPNAPELRQGGLPNRAAAPHRPPPAKKPPKERKR
jgi:FecR-like protein